MTHTTSTEQLGGADTLDPRGFQRLAALAREEAGLTIPDTKLSMVQSRLSRRLSATGHTSFDAYLGFVESAAGTGERQHMISALTTNVSHFFREAHHFDTLREEILPRAIERARRGDQVRLWSAGCSSGQEPYSIAMCLLDIAPDVVGLNFKILASDIDRAILKKAVTGTYSEQQMAGVPATYRDRFFSGSGSGPDAVWTVQPELKAPIAFRQLNLIGPWPISVRFEAIFCRNVVIYFDSDTQGKLWPRFADALVPEGWLFLGHSERMQTSTAAFTAAGVTTYRRANSWHPAGTKG
ncbi:MAG: protein-glutamate O-methyltransferase CheR [Pseudomonadota bacterium]